MAADGSLEFDTKIDTSDFDVSISTLEKAVDRLSKTIDKLSGMVAKGFGTAGSAASEASKDVDVLGASAEVASKEVELIGSAAKESRQRVKSLQEQMDAISIHDWQDNASDVASGTPVAVPVAVDQKSMQYDPKAMAAVFGEAAANIHSYAEAVGMYGNQAGAALNGMSEEAVSAANAAEQAEEAAQSSYVGVKDSVLNGMGIVKNAFMEIPKVALVAVTKIPGIVKNGFSKAAHIAANFGKRIGSSVANGAKRATAGLKSLFKPANKASASILKLSNMFKLMLIRMAMRAAIQGVKEGLQNLVQYSSEANQSMSSLATGATYMKNSFAAAFAPILTIVAPILNTLIDLLATALSYINQFFAALGGSTTFIKAKKVNEDYAKSIKGAGGAAKQAGKDAQKALAPFDELTVLQEQASSGSGGGGGGGVDPSQMFETATISDAVNGFAGQIRQAFEAGDWKELGTLIGQKFNEIVDGVDWSGIGHKIGYGVNGAVQTAYYALKAADFKNLGNHVAELINGALEEIDFTFVGRLLVRGFTAGIDLLIGLLGGLDWGLIGKSVGDFLRGAFDESYEWITSIDWSQMAHNLYSNIKECLLGVDFSSLAESFFKALGAALGAAVSFVASFVGDIWKDINKYFSSYLTNDDGTKKCGLDWVAGILEGILDGIMGIGSWIWENVAQPLIQGFEDAFGIHSPSTVMAELAGYLMEGLLNKIVEMMPDVVSRFGELKENISSKWDEIKAAASEKWSGIQSDLSGFWNGIKESAGTVFGETKDSISKVWEDVKQNTSELWGEGGIQGVISGAVSGIVTGVEGMANSIIRTINGLINNINKISIDIPDTPFSEGFTLGFNIPTLSEVHLPRLASGTVVPPRAGEFAAILGDNNREAEVVSPISTMKQAFREILEEMQGMAGGDIQLTINLDGKVIYNDVVKRNRQTTARTGKNPLLT